jgi:ribosome-dependent ATPase
MITDPLAVALTYTRLGGSYAELATLTTFFLALFTLLLVCIYLKHKDFFTASSRSEKTKLETEDTLLEVRKLSLSMGGDQVLYSLDMTIKEGEIMGLLGANGAGKTTLIKVLLGEVGTVPVGSEVYMKNPKGEVISIKRNLKQVRQNIRFCTQHDILQEEMTVREHLVLTMKLQGLKPQKAKIEEITDKVGLSA